MKSTTGSQHSFAQVPQANIQRSSFNRSAGWKGTGDAGWLIPHFVEEVLPGDTFNHKSTIFGRMSTPIYPIMDNAYLESFFFFVPNRLLFDNWKKMMGEQENPGDSTDYLIPQATVPTNGYTENSLQDYMGLPTKVEFNSHNALPLRAYNLIWNEWFRDQNLQNSVSVPKGDGPDLPSNFQLLRRGKRHDYFTSCLPWPQKGQDVTIPLGTTAPVIPADGSFWFNSVGALGGPIQSTLRNSSVSDIPPGGGATVEVLNSGSENILANGFITPNVVADLTGATAATINQLREAFAVQKLYERDARGGSRYTEIVRSHFGVVSPDARLQRPEYLGGGSSRLDINPVVSKTDTDTLSGGRPLGDLAATGTLIANNHGFTKSFTEHGYIIGLINVRADLNYQQGLNRMWSREQKLDFYWPALAHLGEQEVINKEIFIDGGVIDEEIFGYQERYAEYRYRPSIITGTFRSNAAQTLDAWHLAQDFATRPTLSAQFIEDNPPIDRVIAVPSQPQFIFDCFHSTIAARPMPLFGVPGQIDRF